MPTRRDLMLGAALGAATFGRRPLVSAQDGGGATPRDGSGAVYPELRLTRTFDGYHVPAEVAAGRIVLIVDDPDGIGGAVNIVRPAAGDSGADLVYRGTPVSGNNTGGTPARDNAIWAGGEYFPPGGSVTGTIMDLEPGTWFVLDMMDPGGAPASFEAAEGAGTVADSVPGIAVDIEMLDFQFRLPDRFVPGPQLWHVWNSGKQVHDIHVLAIPEGTAAQDIVDALYPPAGATPAADGIDPQADMVPQFGIATISAGREIWKEVALGAGTYAITTWASDKESGMPHLALGMISVFTVAEP